MVACRIYFNLLDGVCKHVEEIFCDVEILDYSGYSIAPGLVDTIHGFGGVDVMDNNIELFLDSEVFLAQVHGSYQLTTSS